MSVQITKTHPLISVASNSLINLPTPSSINSNWNYGSTLGVCLMIQIATGLFLAMHYVGSVDQAFEAVSHICYDVNYGWWVRGLHANGASFFFVVVYCHIGRGLYFSSFTLQPVWLTGVLILFALMATAFLGYVLPWGQMSFWGATVITNLISAVPYFGESLVYWIWGGFAVGGSTLTRFFAFHYILPFIILALVGVHLVFLHMTGSSNPLGLNSNLDKVTFFPYFAIKDLVGWVVVVGGLLILSLLDPWLLGDPENFIPANPLVTPVHIKPEWYFLFAYAILRSIPNKLGGVVSLVAAIAILLMLPIASTKFNSTAMSPSRKLLFWMFIGLCFILTWIGGNPVEEPYILIGQLTSVLYFMYYMILSVLA